MHAVRLAVVVVLLVLAAAVLRTAAPPGAESKEGFRWVRSPWRLPAARHAPVAWWSRRRPGYAAPLGQSLPLLNFIDYLHGYPPSARLPYNA